MPEQSIEAQVPIEYVEPEAGKFFAYANQVGYGFTPADVRLIFGELIDFEDGKAVVEQRAQITIPWIQAKATAMTLMALVSKHEEHFGVINVPPNYIQAAP